jgi:two-component system response regulator (stage 0 sporulation protein F)
MGDSATKQDTKKILVVEDEESLQLLYKQELSSEGYCVFSTSTAKDAMSILTKERFDLVVLDIKLPDMGGNELLEKMLLRHRNMKVVINSAYAQFKDDFSSWLADDYIIKSSDLSELKTTIHRNLN